MPEDKSKTQPKISVAVVTFNQAHYLDGFLNRYRQFQKRLPVTVPLLIVDDGSNDGTNKILETAAACNDGLSFLSTSHQGIANARNTALKIAQTPWLAFTDTDCLPATDYLERLLEIPYRFSGKAAVEGAVLNYPTQLQTRFCHTLKNARGGMYVTANMVFHVKSALEAGGFDKLFGNYREDVDLALRLSEMEPIPFWPALRVMHPPIPRNYRHSLTSAWSRYSDIISAELRLFEKHVTRYGRVRAHSNAKATLNSWRAKHVFHALKTYKAIQHPAASRTKRSVSKFGFSVSDIFKCLTTALWEQACINVLCLRWDIFRRLNSGEQKNRFTHHGQKKNVLLIWTGGVVPSYKHFFRELGCLTKLSILSPRQWKHGSKITQYHKENPDDSNYRLFPTTFFPSQSAKYVIPLLPLYLWRLKPNCIYLMDEIDRVNTLVHVLCIRLCRPRALIVTYSLQNLQQPSYYRFYHRLAVKLNNNQIHRIIAASREAETVLRQHGYSKSTAVVPLGVSPHFFFPAKDKLALRHRYGINPNITVLIYAGSLAREKGIDSVASMVSEIPGLALLVAGQGPLEDELRELPADKIRLYGALSGEQLRDCYQVSDFVILPSKTTPDWQEQIGRSLLEGILCGCTAIGCRSGYIPEITLLPETLFEENSLASLERLLYSLKTLDRQPIYEKQLKQLMRRFTWKAVAGRTFQFLREAPS